MTKILKIYKREMEFVVKQVNENYPSIEEQVESVCTILNYLVGAGVSETLVMEFTKAIGIKDYEENGKFYLNKFYEVIESHV